MEVDCVRLLCLVARGCWLEVSFVGKANLNNEVNSKQRMGKNTVNAKALDQNKK